MKTVSQILGASSLSVKRRKKPPPAASYYVRGARHTAPIVGETSCIITCHNYGHFLAGCLDSLLAQTKPFTVILVVDDGSEDGTKQVADEYAARGVRYLRGNWRDFNVARKAGIAVVSKTSFYLFVDADNWLAIDYHQALLEPMANPKVGVAYGTIHYVDEDGRDLRTWFTEFDYWRLRLGNYADACSLVRSEVLDQVGGWKTGSLSDWMLWLDATRAGWNMVGVQRAHLMYRQHSQSMTERRLQSRAADLKAKVEAVQESMMITIVTLFSGRFWQLPRYAEFLWALLWNHSNLHVVAVDNSRDPAFNAFLRANLADSGISYTCVTHPGRALPDASIHEVCDSIGVRMGNVYDINVHMARLYAYAGQYLPKGTDLVWCLEDDIEPPLDALEHFCVGFQDHEVGVIAGVVMDRFADRLLAWRGSWTDHSQGEHSGYLKAPPQRGEFPIISASGFMCTIFRRQVWDALSFRPSPGWGDQYCYYDWAAAKDVSTLGWKWVLAGSVRCKHWQVGDTFLTPDAG